MSKRVAAIFIIFLLVTSKFNGFPQPAEVPANSGYIEYLPDSVLRPANFITESEAELILGKPVHLKDNLLKYSGKNARFQFTYVTNFLDSLTCARSSVFFGFQQYSQATEATRALFQIREENRRISFIEDFTESGSEGFLAIDQWGYPFIMIRKNSRTFKFRILNESGSKSRVKLKELAGSIVSEY